MTDTSRRETDLALARLGRVVRELREECGLSVEELSVACKIARWRLTRIEAGSLRTVDYGELCKLAEAFDLSGGEFVRKAKL
ncbi:MAG: helix-turn-helix transcriptional regulator [Solirubrobacteraceae bacterium]